jgi:hypothetical protein
VIDASTLSGIEVHFGTMEEYAYKFEVLLQLVARAMATGEQVVIDVSVPDRPVIRSKDQPVVLAPEEEGDIFEAEIDEELETPLDEVEEIIFEEGYQQAVEEEWIE